jgi:hypothetical protein
MKEKCGGGGESGMQTGTLTECGESETKNGGEGGETETKSDGGEYETETWTEGGGAETKSEGESDCSGEMERKGGFGV